MKKFVILFITMFCNFVFAETINLHWLNDNGTTYTESTCTVDDDLIIPTTPPTKYGYTFTGWEMQPFTPIEYIESTGTQYIDTGVVPEYQYTYEISFMWLVGNYGTSAMFLVGGTDGRWFGIEYGYELMFFSGYKEGNTVHIYDKKLLLMMSKDQCKLNGNDCQMLIGRDSNTFNTSIRLFSGINSYYSKGRIYYFQIYDNDVLVRDFIPVIDKNGVPCMYDKVEGKFYYNAGTGQFVAGPVIGE